MIRHNPSFFGVLVPGPKAQSVVQEFYNTFFLSDFEIFLDFNVFWDFYIILSGQSLEGNLF